MIFALGIVLLLIHAIPVADVLSVLPVGEPTLSTITGNVIVGYVALAIMLYGFIEGLVKRSRHPAVTVVLAVIMLLSLPVALSNESPSAVMSTYVCRAPHQITFVTTNGPPPKGCRQYHNGEVVRP